MTAEELAELFHETYEGLAPHFKWTTYQETAVPWKEVPEPNRSLMIVTASIVLNELHKGTI